MTRKLAARGFTGGAPDLRRTLAAEYWLAASEPERSVHAPDAAGDRWPAWTRRWPSWPAGRAYNPQRNHRALPPYPEADWDKLASACRTIAGESFDAHRGRSAAAAARAAPGRRRLDAGEPALAAGQDRTGIVRAARRPAGLHPGRGPAARRVRRGQQGLFPSQDVLIAYRLLFGIYSGIVPDGIDDLVTSDIDWTGDASVLLSYVKGRTAAESLSLPAAGGPAPGAVAVPLRPAAQLRRRAGPAAPMARAQPPRAPCRDHRKRRTGLDPALGGPPPRHRPGRTAAEDPPGTDPHDLSRHAGQERVGGTRPGHHRPQPQPAGRGRPLPELRDAGPAHGHGGHRRGRPARPAAQGQPAGCP